jgi:molybdenum cofactor cytidylyltransferase
VIAAVVVAAGESKRMGRPKLVMPWGETTVIGKVLTTLAVAGLDEIVVVTGGAHQEVEAALIDMPFARNVILQTVYNPNFADGEMLSSIQVGLSHMKREDQAALLALGDQPQIQVEVIREVLKAYHAGGARLVVPSYQMRRGHPWLIDRSLWRIVLDMHSPMTMRDFLRQQQDEIGYVNVNTPAILTDLDTPEDYQREAPSR